MGGSARWRGGPDGSGFKLTGELERAGLPSVLKVLKRELNGRSRTNREEGGRLENPDVARNPEGPRRLGRGREDWEHCGWEWEVVRKGWARRGL